MSGYEKSVPNYTATGTAMPDAKMATGFAAGDKPPAAWFNWLFYSYSQALLELQNNAIHNEQKGAASGVASLNSSGHLPITQGGTGAGTAEEALSNLGLTATATEINYVDGVTSNIQTQLNNKVNTSNVLTKTNTTSYTPSANYHPATKKYVDDSLANGGYGDMLKSVYDTDNSGAVDLADAVKKGSYKLTAPTLSGDGVIAVKGDISASTDITKGTLDITRGGTGASTAAGALTNLGLTATASELNTLDGIIASTTELNYCDGVTSSIQDQLNSKASSTHKHSASDITSGTLSIARGGTGASTAAGALTNLGLTATASELNYCDGVTSNIQTQLDNKASEATYTATISTVWTGDSAPYTQDVTVTGILANDNPIVDVVLSSVTSTALLQLEAWGMVGRIVTAANKITVTCYEDKPTVEIPIQLKVVK